MFQLDKVYFILIFYLFEWSYASSTTNKVLMMSNAESLVSGPTDATPVQFKSSGSRKPRQRKQFVKGELRTPTNAGPPAPPTALSTKPSVMRDDPFLVDEFEVDGMSLQPNNLRPKFAVTHAGFMDLVELSYEYLCQTDRYFVQHVPFSIYAYYCGQLLQQVNDQLCDNYLDEEIATKEWETQEMYGEKKMEAERIVRKYLTSLESVSKPNLKSLPKTEETKPKIVVPEYQKSEIPVPESCYRRNSHYGIVPSYDL